MWLPLKIFMMYWEPLIEALLKDPIVLSKDLNCIERDMNCFMIMIYDWE